MYQEYDAAHAAYVTRDAHGIAREVSHRQRPFRVDVQTPQMVAQAYLERHRDLLGIRPESLTSLSLSPEAEPVDADVEYRLLEEKTSAELVTVAYYQTCFGLPVWEAGLAVHIARNPDRVISSTFSAHENVKPKKPKAPSLRRFRKVSPKTLVGILELPSKGGEDAYDLESLRVNRTRLIIYRYVASKRLPHGGPRDDVEEPAFPYASPSLPVPPPDKGIKEGNHYVAAEILFTLATARWGTLNWIAIVEVETGSVLYLRALVDNVDGMVYMADPSSQASAAAPSANNATLNPLRTSVTLQGLVAPAGGNQSLAGNFVQVSDHEAPTVAPPTQAVGSNFNYSVRTNNFAAVNCYHHADGVFRLIQDLGFTISSYFDGTTFPVSIDHRGRFGSLDGIEINASCGGNATSNGIGLPDFELADLTDTTNPLGIAADRRVVMHELFGHGILWDHVNSANFGFAHSAGDSFAAILNDPDSQATDRFLTFPWLTTSRRHDRAVASGFGWSGSIALNPFDSVLDLNGYQNEQILSTTMFRIYRSLGGDSSRVETCRFAARYVAYLMLRAVGALTPATNPGSGSGFASALITADGVDWTSEGHAGGAYGKVIRWAFEKQGMYQPAGTITPNNSEGAPPAVDVYIDDMRHGEYAYLANHWSCQKIWNRLAADGGAAHETPIVGVSNYAYVKIKNRGSQTATNVVVRGFHCQPATGLTWPSDWQAMTTSQLAAPDVAPNDASEITVGPFEWVPSQPDHECMLMIVSANGDPSNIDNFSGGDSIPEWRLVPHDNNVGQRNVAPVPGGGGFRGLLAAFAARRFVARNPHRELAKVVLRPKLPKLLVERGWEIYFDNPGGGAFTLAPGQSREIVVKLRPGADFSADDVATAEDPAIHVEVLANGILVGGMSYQLDPKLREPARQFPTGKPGACRDRAKELLDCLDLPVDGVRCVRIRKITVDIELGDDRDC